MTPDRLALLAACLLLTTGVARSQPTYKLDVRPDLKPQATLSLDGLSIKRTPVADDPGFRLQYHFKKDAKTVATPEARSAMKVDLPTKEPGTYTVVLELFHPAYKGGVAQKGEFKPVSNVLTFRIEPPAKPGEAVRVVAVETPKPPLPAPPAPKK